MPGPHPDDDLLADLAADVLPLDQARAVEAHVLGCDRCAQLLSDADRVRGLLLADDPGPVPPEVWHRIEAALAAESHRLPQTAATAPRIPPAPTADSGGGWDGPDPLDAPEHWDRRERRPADHGAAPPAEAPVAGTPTTGSPRRLSTSRRDARGGRRRPWPSPLLLTAAAAVALVAVVGSVRLLNSGGNAASNSSGASAALSSGAARDSSASGAPRIVSSGRNYTQQDLAAQVRPLIAPIATPKRSGAAIGSGQGEVSGSGPSAPVPAAGVASGASAAGAHSVAPDTDASDVSNPQRLAACVTALNASTEPVVAVDLARFQGRKAAVLVLRAPNGSYEIFVVERTCAPGHEGTLAYTQLPG